MILCIETATYICSVALCDKGKVIYSRESDVDKSHAALLTVFIQELLNKAGIKASELDAVAVSKGPGSYTGLRIGVSTAKGICYGASIPLIGINTLESMFYGGLSAYSEIIEKEKNIILCPMIDARRMEVYSSLYNINGEKLRDVTAEVIDKDSYSAELESRKVIFFGNGADKCKDIITHSNAVFNTGYRLSANTMVRPAEKAFRDKHFEDIAYFEPFYLKDFIATIPRKNILGK